MKILIVTNNYLQKSVISSKRWRCFSKYLSEDGHDVTVVCGDDESYMGDSFTIDELANGRLNILKYSSLESIFVLLLKIIRILKGRKQSLPHSKSVATVVYSYLSPLSFFAYIKSYFLCWMETMVYEQFCLSRLRKSKILNQIGKLKFDAIVASCGPLDSIILGEKIHNHFKNTPYYTEFRDMLHSRMYLNKAQNDFYINYEKKHVDIANGTFVVSNGQKEMLCESICTTNDIMNKIFVLYHGFDSKMNDLVSSLDNNDALNPKLVITYTGTLDPAVEDPRMLFHALSMLINEGTVVKNKIQIVYVGLGYDYFEDSARTYKLDSIISYEGFVTPVEAVQYQFKSDILLLLADNSRFQKGILGGKFSEYISIRKPLIALTVGDLAGAEITSLINEMNIGVACEYVDYDKSIKELKMFLLLKYNEKLKNGYLEFATSEEKIHQFSYEALTKKLVCILHDNN